MLDALAMIGAAIAALVAAYFAGVRKARQNEAQRRAAERDKARQDFNRIKTDVETQDDQELVDRISRGGR